MDLNAVCDAIALTLNTAAIQINGAQLTASSEAPDALTVPHFFCAEFVGQYHKSYSGLWEITLTSRLMTSRSDDKSGQRAVRSVANTTGAGTLLGTLEAARGAPGQKALSGACDDIVVTRVTGPRLFEIGSVQFYGLEFSLLIVG